MNNKYLKKIVFTLTFITFLGNAISQRVENKCDTVTVLAPAYLVLKDTSIHVNKDSTAIICDKYIVITKKNGYAIYNKIIGESQKHVMLDRLFQMLIASSTQDTMLIRKQQIKAEDAYSQYSGKIIRNIDIKVLKPFGPTLSDTNLPVISTWAEALNKSHITTRDFTIRQKLMFKKNQSVNPYEIVENVNELSKLPFLQDATIILTNASNDSVDVLVLAKDKFPWLPALNITSIDKMSFYLTQVNILGTGHSLGGGLTMDTKSSPMVYFSDLTYYNNNLYNQISATAKYHISDNDKFYQISLHRNIIPLNIRAGGGLDLFQKEENIVIDPTDIDQNLWYFKYRFMEVWTSYLFYKKSKKDREDNSHVFFIPGIAMSGRQYLYRPTVTIDSNSRFDNYNQLLGNFAVAQQNYIRTNFYKSFGKAEYIPIGFQATITGGYTWSEFMQKPYLGVGLIGMQHYDNIGYISANFQIGSHFSDKLLQGAINLGLTFLTSNYKINRYRYRFMAVSNYTTGINRYTDDLLYLGEYYGFVGINNKSFYGKRRLFSEFGIISYTPWYFLGFRFAVFGFFSAGILGDDYTPILKNKLLTSFGVGIYIKNDFLAFNSFQVRAAYFPNTPAGISHFGVSFSTIGLIEKMNFLDTKPKIVEYN